MIKCPDCYDGYDWYEHPECTVMDHVCHHGGRCWRKYNKCERCDGTGEIHPDCLFCGEPNTREGAKEGDDCDTCTNALKCLTCGDPLIGDDTTLEDCVQSDGTLICKTCRSRNCEIARKMMEGFAGAGQINVQEGR